MDEHTTVSIDQEVGRTFIPCPFQKPCWKQVRAPLARKNKVYLPYVCSFQSEGDVYKCSRYWGYKEAEARDNIDDKSLPPNGAGRDDL
jgi:hypothetical protein